MIFEQKQYDKSAGRILSFFFIINVVNIFIKQNVSISFINRYLTPFLGCLYIFYLIKEKKYVKKVFLRLILAEIFFVLLIGMSALRYPDSIGSIIKRSLWIVMFCVPLAVISTKVKDYKIFIDQTNAANMFVMILCVLSWLLTMRQDGHFTYGNYNMVIGYTLLFPLFYHVVKGCKEKKYLIFAFLEAVVVITYGSRGQLFCIIVFSSLFTLKGIKTDKRVLALILLVIFAGLSAIFYQEFIGGIASIIDKIGSRTLSMLLRGRITYGTGRVEIWAQSWERILQKPFLGWGICGELAYMTSSPHNIFLEIMLHYGIIFGTVINLWMIGFIIKFLLGRKLNTELLIMFCSSFIPLLLSNTYTETPVFWVLAILSSKKIK